MLSPFPRRVVVVVVVPRGPEVIFMFPILLVMLVPFLPKFRVMFPMRIFRIRTSLTSRCKSYKLFDYVARKFQRDCFAALAMTDPPHPYPLPRWGEGIRGISDNFLSLWGTCPARLLPGSGGGLAARRLSGGRRA